MTACDKRSSLCFAVCFLFNSGFVYPPDIPDISEDDLRQMRCGASFRQHINGLSANSQIINKQPGQKTNAAILKILYRHQSGFCDSADFTRASTAFRFLSLSVTLKLRIRFMNAYLVFLGNGCAALSYARFPINTITDGSIALTNDKKWFAVQLAIRLCDGGECPAVLHRTTLQQTMLRVREHSSVSANVSELRNIFQITPQ